MIPTDEELRAKYAGLAMPALISKAGSGLILKPREVAHQISQTSFEIARMMVIVRKEKEKEFVR